MILFDGGAPVDVFEEFAVIIPMEVDINEVVDEEVTFEEFADEEDIPDILVGREVTADAIGAIWFGAGEAVLWLDTESGLADSSMTISPGDPGESGGRSFVLLDDT